MKVRIVILAAVVVTLPSQATNAGLCAGPPPGNDIASWSPDGGTLVATAPSGPCPDWRTALVSRGGSFRWLDAPMRAVSWAPDGRQIAVASNEGPLINVLDTATAIGRQVAEGSDPAWSPDSSLIAYTGLNGGVYVVEPNGTGHRFVTAGARPTWSPNSDRLAFERSGSVFVANADGTGATMLAIGDRPVWSPGGGWIAVERAGAAVAVRVDGAGERTLGPGRVVSWSPDEAEALIHDRTSGVARLVSLPREAVPSVVRRVAEDAATAAAPPQWDRLASVIRVGRQLEIYFSAMTGAQPRRVTPSQCWQYLSICRHGTDRADRFVGTAQREVVFPGAGDDRIWSRAGDDRIDTAYGRDFVDAGPGNDIVFAHGNDDRIFGRAGVDHIFAGDGEDVVDAGAGRDIIVVSGDERVDRVRCGPGRPDTVYAELVDRVARDCENVTLRP